MNIVTDLGEKSFHIDGKNLGVMSSYTLKKTEKGDWGISSARLANGVYIEIDNERGCYAYYYEDDIYHIHTLN